MGKKSRRILISILLGIAVFGIVHALSHTPLLRSFERYSYDYRFRLRGPQEVHPDIVFVGIDDKCEDTLGKRCWEDRLNHARMLEYLSDYPPSVVGFDILFNYESYRQQIRKDDEALVNVIDYFDPGTVCMAYNFIFPDNLHDPATEREIELLEKFEIKTISGDLSKIEPLEDVSLPFDALAGTVDLGFINAPRDPDGGVRRLPMILGLKTEGKGNTFYPSFSLLMSCRHLNIPLDSVKVVMGKHILIPREGAADIKVPIDSEGYMLVNFFAEHHSFHPISFAQLVGWNEVEFEMDADLVENKLLLVGLTTTGSTDENPTPLSPVTPLATVHLNAVNSILRNEFVYESPAWVDLFILLLLSLGLGLCNGVLPPIKSSITTSLILIAYLITSLMIFTRWSIIIPVVQPVLAIILVYCCVIFYRFFTEERQKIWIRKVLGQYLSANVMHEVLEDPDNLKLGGTRKNLTVMFSDIRGFTPICEKLPPEQVVQVLNEYLDKMTECIFKHSGTLDKYVGDEIVAFFGAPGSEHQDDHSLHAVLAALDMRDELRKLQKQWSSDGQLEFEAGIGINTGDMLVGNMGSSNVFDYTVIGDEVNLGARVEQLTRTYDAWIIITESTYENVKDILDIKELGIANIRGREKGVRIYEVLGRKDKPS